MKKLRWCVGLVFLVGCGTGLGELKEFSSPEGKFKVKMPGTPQKKNQDAGGIQVNAYAVEGRNGAMIVAYSDIPIPPNESEAQIQARLDGSRDGMLKNSNATLTKETKIQLPGGHFGREVHANLNNKKGEFRARFWLVGTKLYQVMAMGTPSFTNSEDATTFLQSFELSK